MSAAERSNSLNLGKRRRRMEPYLQFMCGPLLRYDTVVEHDVWRGAAMIVSESFVYFSFRTYGGR
jgi:hypothetical protein